MLRTSSLLAIPLLSSLLLAAPAAAQPAERIRGGVGIVAGHSAPGTLAALGLQGRLGAQIDDRMGVFAEAEIFYGGSYGSRGGLMFCGAFTPEFEITLADHFFVAGGPTLYLGAYAPTTGDPAYAPMPGAKLRVGVGLGSKTPARRHQFTLAVEPRFIYSFDSGPTGFFSIALGYDAK